jgi:post-segregation antitoxin (ccd killing protein)
MRKEPTPPVERMGECQGGQKAPETEGTAEAFLRENRDAMDAWNAHVEEHGLPLGKYRNF